MKSLARAVMLILLLFNAGVLISSADSPPPLPNTFSGTVKFTNSSGQFDVPAGTVIESLIENVTKGSSTVIEAGKYRIDVSGTYDDDGKNITFIANNRTAEQRVFFNASSPPPRALNLIVNLQEQTTPVPNNVCAALCHNYEKRIDRDVDFYPNTMTSFNRYETFLGILNEMRDIPMNVTDPTIDFYFNTSQLYGNRYDYFRKVQPLILENGRGFFEFNDMTLSNGNGTYGIDLGERNDTLGFSVLREIENNGFVTEDGYYNVAVSAVLYEDVNGFIALSVNLENSSEYNAWLVGWNSTVYSGDNNTYPNGVNVNFNTWNETLPKNYNLTATFYVDKTIPANITLKPWVSAVTRRNLQTIENVHGYNISINGTKFNMNSTFASNSTNLAWIAQEGYEKHIELDGGVVDILDPYAVFSFNKDFVAGSDNDSLNSGNYNSNLRYNLDINNENDASDTVLGNISFIAKADNITSVGWGEYATWNKTAVSWSFPSSYIIQENEGFGTGFDTNYSESKYLNVNISRWMNQTEFGNDGYQLAKFNATFNDKNFEWVWARIEANERHEVNPSIVKGTFTTNAPGRFNEWEHGVHFDFDKDSIVPGVTYNFSVVVRANLTGNEAPLILYKPKFSVGMGLYYNSIVSQGYKVEMPKEMLPDNVSYASASTNASNAWLIKRHNHVIAELRDVSELVGPHAQFSFSKDFVVGTDNDSLSSGNYDSNLRYHFDINNRDDTSDTILGNLRFSAGADNITNVDWEQYAAWNKTSVNWTFPPSYIIQENNGFGTGFSTNHSESKYLNAKISRWMNQTEFSTDGYQLAKFNVTFENKDFEWEWARIEANDIYGIDASIVPGTFMNENNVIGRFNEWEHGIQFDFTGDHIQTGANYSFSVILKIRPTGERKPPVFYKPEFFVGEGANMDFANGGTGTTVEVPSAMLPESIHYISASTNVSNAWLINRHNNTIAALGRDRTPPVVTDFKVEPNTSVSSANPATASAYVSDENLMDVAFGVIDSSNLVDTNMTVLGLYVNESGVNGIYASPPWYADVGSITNGTVQDSITTMLHADWLDYLYVPGSFKKNATGGEEEADLWFNRINGSLLNITSMKDANPLIIESGNSTFKISKFKFTEGLNNPPRGVDGVTFVLYSIGNLNNPYIISIPVPSGTYKVVVHAVDTEGNNNGVLADVEVAISPNETVPPNIFNPSATPLSIPDDTDSDPRGGETSQLNVTVSDESGVAGVTINLSALGKSAAQPMALIAGSNISGTWSVTTNASAGKAGFHDLRVNAADIYGNSNTNVKISLRVLNNGDANQDGTKTLADAMYLAKYVLNKPGFENAHPGASEVSGDGSVTLADAMYLAKNILNKPGFEVLH